MNNTNKLTDWVINKIENEYKDDIALLLAISGHSTDGDQHGECFDYFVPATDRGNELTETFIIGGVGHDLYPRSWERLEDSVNLNDMPIVLDGARILYSRSKDDEDRFLELQKRLNDNLANDTFVYGKALEYMDKALEIYRSLIFEDLSYRVISEAGYVHLFLSKAVAVLNHTYVEEPIMSMEQAYNNDPESRIYHCPGMKQVPEGFFDNAKALMNEKDPQKIKEIVLKLLKTTRRFILDQDPENQPKVAPCEDYAGLANWYQELSLTWRRIRFFASKNMAEEAYCDAGYLQQELFYIAQEFGIPEMNLFDSYDASDLSKLVKCADDIEQKILSILEGHKTPVNSYESIEAFLEARS